MATIYRKTTKGQAEIETRAAKLAPRFRQMLIMVDGRRSDDDLRAMFPTGSDETLAALAAGGFIEAISVSAGPPRQSAKATASEPAPAAPANPAMGFTERRQAAVRMLTDLVGPMAEALALRIERARTPEEMAPLIATAAQVLANTRGRQVAQDFVQRFGG